MQVGLTPGMPAHWRLLKARLEELCPKSLWITNFRGPNTDLAVPFLLQVLPGTVMRAWRPHRHHLGMSWHTHCVRAHRMLDSSILFPPGVCFESVPRWKLGTSGSLHGNRG